MKVQRLQTHRQHRPEPQKALKAQRNDFKGQENNPIDYSRDVFISI